VLENIAPAEAIFVIRENEGHFDEREVICDPYALGSISVAAQLAV
jgi:hypothetical protein